MRFRTAILIATQMLWLSTSGALMAAGEKEPLGVPAGEGWSRVSTTPTLTVYGRAKPGSHLKEYHAVGLIAAPNWVVESVLEDAEAYPSFMPYVVECRVLSRNPDGVTTYQHVSPPFISERDYVLRVRASVQSSNGRTVYVRQWEIDPRIEVPARHGTIRLKVNQGSWILESVDETTTRASYSVFGDPGGSVPPAVLNYANQSAIPKLFAAIEKQAREKKYWQKPITK